MDLSQQHADIDISTFWNPSLFFQAAHSTCLPFFPPFKPSNRCLLCFHFFLFLKWIMRISYDYVNYHYLLAAIKKFPSGCQCSKTWIFFSLLGLKPLFSASVLTILINIPVTPRRGYSGFQETGMPEWGQKSKSKKVLWASNKTKKMPGPKLQNFQAIKMSRQHQII